VKTVVIYCGDDGDGGSVRGDESDDSVITVVMTVAMTVQ
jgi:hypothetical protein